MLKKSSLLIVFLFATLVAGFFPVSFLSISSNEFHCVTRSETFSLRWRHSVEKQLWYEHYRIDGQQFVLFESWLQTFGAGTPSAAKATSAPAGFVGYKHDVRLDELNWTVSPRMEGTIIFGKQFLPLYQQLAEYSKVEFKVGKSPLWFYFLRSACNVKSQEGTTV